MPEEIKTRNMLVIATNKTTGKGHYILKVGVHGKIIAKNAETLCGLIQPEQVHKVLHITSPAIMDCKRCKQVFTKHEEIRLAKVQLEEVKMFKTSDGKTFPISARTAALKHEDRLTSLKKEKEFIASVERVLFTNAGVPDESLLEAFEQDVGDAIESNFVFGQDHAIGSETIYVKEFLGFLHEMLTKHGAKIRQMVILYQKLHGTLVPFSARTAALRHEDKLVSLKKEEEFVASVKKALFTDGDTIDDMAIEEFEEDFTAILEHAVDEYPAGKLANESMTLEDFLTMFHALLARHGAKIRQMVILYQKLYGTLVPCRNTMENMKRGGNNIYL